MAVDPGQMERDAGLGLNYMTTMFEIIIQLAPSCLRWPMSISI